MVVPLQDSGVRILGRYALYDEIAAGGMATVHIGRLLGPVGFSRTVAIKRLHPQFAKDPDFVSMFLDEARLAARVRHPNVIGTLDVVALSGELFLVMEYVPGESFARLWRSTRDAGRWIPPPIVASILIGVLEGLHAAHEATNDRGEPLGIVHRDVSPHNVMVGTDGVARVLDFGVAKASGRLQTTREGQLKGKISYMAPEQVQGIVDRTTDVYAASVVLWEGLTGQRLFFAENEARTLANVLYPKVVPPSEHAPGIPPELDAVVLRGLHKDPAQRFASAREMARALQRAIAPAPTFLVGEWVEGTAGLTLATRAARVASIERIAAPESDSGSSMPAAAPLSVATPIASSMTPPPMTRSAVPPPISSIDLRRAHGEERSRAGPAGSDEARIPEAPLSDAEPIALVRRRVPRSAGIAATLGLLLAVGALSAVTVMRLHPQPHGVALGPAKAAAFPASASGAGLPPRPDEGRVPSSGPPDARRSAAPGSAANGNPAGIATAFGPPGGRPATSDGVHAPDGMRAGAFSGATGDAHGPRPAPPDADEPPAGSTPAYPTAKAPAAGPNSPERPAQGPPSSDSAAGSFAPAPGAKADLTPARSSPRPPPAPSASAKPAEGEFEHVIDSRK